MTDNIGPFTVLDQTYQLVTYPGLKLIDCYATAEEAAEDAKRRGLTPEQCRIVAPTK